MEFHTFLPLNHYNVYLLTEFLDLLDLLDLFPYASIQDVLMFLDLQQLKYLDPTSILLENICLRSNMIDAGATPQEIFEFFDAFYNSPREIKIPLPLL